MDEPKRLDRLVSALRDDVASGATELVHVAADILFQAARTVHAESVPRLRAALVHTAIRILDAQPAMAPLVALVTSVLDTCLDERDLHRARAAAGSAALDFARAVPARASGAARRAAGLLPRGGEVLVLSSSSTVLGALLHGAPAERGVIVLESRPVREGRDSARALAHAGLPVRFAVDAAAGTLVREASCVLLGADSIGDRGIVNKIGSLVAVLAARDAGVPVLVAADSTKILPVGFPQHLADDRPPGQVWQAPPGIRVWNRYFEAVPLEDPIRVVTESDVLSPEAVEAHRHDLEPPGEVLAWARAKGLRPPIPPPR